MACSSVAGCAGKKSGFQWVPLTWACEGLWPTAVWLRVQVWLQAIHGLLIHSQILGLLCKGARVCGVFAGAGASIRAAVPANATAPGAVPELPDLPAEALELSSNVQSGKGVQAFAG